MRAKIVSTMSTIRVFIRICLGSIILFEFDEVDLEGFVVGCQYYNYWRDRIIEIINRKFLHFLIIARYGSKY